jgi:hypothetical protein
MKNVIKGKQIKSIHHHGRSRIFTHLYKLKTGIKLYHGFRPAFLKIDHNPNCNPIKDIINEIVIKRGERDIL